MPLLYERSLIRENVSVKKAVKPLFPVGEVYVKTSNLQWHLFIKTNFLELGRYST